MNWSHIGQCELVFDIRLDPKMIAGTLKKAGGTGVPDGKSASHQSVHDVCLEEADVEFFAQKNPQIIVT